MNPRVLLFDLKQNVDFKNAYIQDYDNHDYQNPENINWYINIIFIFTINIFYSYNLIFIFKGMGV